VHRLVDDLECHKRGQFEILQADADLGGALANHADMRRGSDDFVDTARALRCTDAGELKRQPGDRRQFVPVKLKARPSQKRASVQPGVRRGTPASATGPALAAAI